MVFEAAGYSLLGPQALNCAAPDEGNMHLLSVVATPAQREKYLAPLCRDFADTAAVVAQLDLVISVDTAVAHLAGALGTPCWVLLPDHQPDWRWFGARDDSPWYPGAIRSCRPPGTWTPAPR